MKFAINDPVRIIAPRSRHFGAVGTVVDIVPADHIPFLVGGIDTLPLWFGDHELTAVYQPQETA